MKSCFVFYYLMCYSPELSLTLGILGLLASSYLHWQKRPYLRNVYLFYTMMEWTQFVRYHYLDQCGSFVNLWLTYFIHILVIVQPYMWNQYRLKTNTKRKEIFRFATHLSILWAFFYTMRLFPSAWTGSSGTTYSYLNLNECMVGTKICSYQGPVHLYWQLPYYSVNGFEPNFYSYLILFIYPALYEDNYGAFKLFFWLAQLVYSNRTCGSIHELPTIWCAISILILPMTIFFDQK